MPPSDRRNRDHRLVLETNGTEGVLERLQIDEHPERANRLAVAIADGISEQEIAHMLSGHHRHERAIALAQHVGSPLHRVERRLAGIECRDLPAIGRREFQAQDGSTTVHRAHKDSSGPFGVKGAHDGNARQPSRQIVQLANVAIDKRGHGPRNHDGLLAELVFPFVQAQPAGPAGGREQRERAAGKSRERAGGGEASPRNVPLESTRS